MVAKSKPATYEDVLAAPEHMVAEILNGELVLSPRPAYRDARASSSIGVSLGTFDGKPRGDDPGGWWILDEPELHLGYHIMVPDLAGWRRERLPEIPDVAWLDLPPDWVCEVASPSTRRHDRMVKTGIYLEHGVGWMWLVTPTEETVEVFHADAGRWVLAATAIGPRRGPAPAVRGDRARRRALVGDGLSSRPEALFSARRAP
ncbi:MAG: Uma2 family endonuclease [Deltaproteobacteria bacterium]|nr:Uma2 family endonuclease [Deltaproteobacteria bacterium]